MKRTPATRRVPLAPRPQDAILCGMQIRTPGRSRLELHIRISGRAALVIATALAALVSAVAYHLLP